jgi:hypothetical protein
MTTEPDGTPAALLCDREGKIFRTVESTRGLGDSGAFRVMVRELLHAEFDGKLMMGTDETWPELFIVWFPTTHLADWEPFYRECSSISRDTWAAFEANCAREAASDES